MALNFLGQAIDLFPEFVNAYYLRATIMLIMPDYPFYLDQVIEDCSKVIDLENGNANAYNDRGRAYMRKGNTELAIEDYRKALIYDPSMTISALNKMSAEITLKCFDDAVGTYGSIKKNNLSTRDKLVSSNLVCIALALDGKSYERYVAPLRNMENKIKYLVDWNPTALDDYLEQLKDEKFEVEKISEALKVNELFKEHFID